MTTPSPTESERPDPTIAGGGMAQPGQPGQPGQPATDDNPARVGTLRGASVQFDARRLFKVVIGLVMATLTALVVIFTVAGFHSNGQIDQLRSRGVPVTVTVTGCLGLLGGSGSNAAGYSCRGVYMLDGKHYAESLPGITFYRPGTEIAAIAVPGDPALLAKASAVSTQHSSASVFIVPGVLGVLLLALVAVVLIRRLASGGPGAQQAEAHPVAAA